MFENILVCLDGSKPNEAILPLVVELAEHFSSKIILLNVIIVPTFLAGLGKIEIEPEESTKSTKQEEDISDYLESIAENLRDKRLDVECVAVEGTVEESVVAFARTNEIGLIALAVHDHGALSRFILGSATDFIIRKTGIPVLTQCPDNVSIFRTDKQSSAS